MYRRLRPTCPSGGVSITDQPKVALRNIARRTSALGKVAKVLRRCAFLAVLIAAGTPALMAAETFNSTARGNQTNAVRDRSAGRLANEEMAATHAEPDPLADGTLPEGFEGQEEYGEWGRVHWAAATPAAGGRYADAMPAGFMAARGFAVVGSRQRNAGSGDHESFRHDNGRHRRIAFRSNIVRRSATERRISRRRPFCARLLARFVWRGNRGYFSVHGKLRSVVFPGFQCLRHTDHRASVR